MSAKAYEINLKKYADVLEYLNRKLDIAIHDKEKVKLSRNTINL